MSRQITINIHSSDTHVVIDILGKSSQIDPQQNVFHTKLRTYYPNIIVHLNKVNDLPMAQFIAAPLLIVWPQWVRRPCGSRWERPDGSPLGHQFCPLLLVKVLSINHPLFLADKLKRCLLETLLCQVSQTSMGHFAEAIGVSASMVGTHVPLHLLERTGKPLRDWSLVGPPVVFLCIFAQSKSITVAAATVSKLSTSIPFTSLSSSSGLQIRFAKS